MELPFSQDDIFGVKEQNFNELGVEIFQWQAERNPVYREYLQLLNIKPASIKKLGEIPFLPISFFKTHKVTTHSDLNLTSYFESSATTGQVTSKHYYNDLKFYKKSFHLGFEKHFGNPKNWSILALLPNYLERQHSSLIAMVNDLILASEKESSGFYLYDHENLLNQIEENEKNEVPTLLFGVSFALLDFGKIVDSTFKHLTIIETGGMKGRRKEITRQELHNQLKMSFGNVSIHSEYGMTELFSQAYSIDGGMFSCPDWMRVSACELDDPFSPVGYGKNGLLQVIDLANVESCSFIATSDIGKLYKDGRFEVLGRFDHSEQRGCNLLLF